MPEFISDQNSLLGEKRVKVAEQSFQVPMPNSP